MIDSILNLLFRCPHRRLTRPVSPVGKAGVPQGQTYVVCLDCGKQFSYDLQEMRVGKPLASSHDTGVLPPGMPPPRGRRLKYAFWASLPVAVFLGTVLKNKRSEEKPPKSEKPRAG